MMSDSFHDQESSPSSLISVPNHLPNSTRLPGFRSIGISLASRTDSNDPALLRLLIGSVGNDDAAFGFLLGVDAAHNHAVVQGTKLGLGHGLLAALAARFVARKVSIFQPSSTHQKRVPTAVWEIFSLQRVSR